MVAQVMKVVHPGGVSYDAALIASGIALQFAFAYYLVIWTGCRASAGAASPRR
jgi:hypothetical protein